jgi:hypothetical protein
MKAGSRAITLGALCLMLASCGDGGQQSASSPASATGFSQQYTASAVAGEILTYAIDTQNLTYSYQILYSAYGLNNVTGNGMLIRNTDGSFSPTDAPTSKVYALPNGLLVGTVPLILNNVPVSVPILGISQPISSLPSLAGTYNFVGIQCANQTFGVFTGCDSVHGTAEVDAVGRYTACSSGNLIGGTGGCASLTTATLNLLGNGIWRAVEIGSASMNYVLAHAAPNGQTVLVVDLNDPGGYGYGYLVMSTQAGYVQSEVDGTWYYQSNHGTAGALAVSGNTVFDQGNIYTLSFDSPWTGMASVSTGATAILAGTGAYALVHPGFPGYLEVGMQR